MTSYAHVSFATSLKKGLFRNRSSSETGVLRFSFTTDQGAAQKRA